MERRRFLQLLGLGVGAIALDQAIPLGRVWSFPKEIAIKGHIRGVEWFDPELPYRTRLSTTVDPDQLLGIHFKWDSYERLVKMSYESDSLLSERHSLGS